VGKEYLCKPFNYDEIPGEPFEKTLSALSHTFNKKRGTEKTVPIYPYKVKIYLKVTKDKILDRRVYFINKGRRITSVSSLEQFRTTQKSYIWSHPNVIGYIDVTGVLEPSLTRDSFEDSENLKPLFYTLLKLEPEIKAYVQAQLGSYNSGGSELIDQKLNDAYQKFLKDMHGRRESDKDKSKKINKLEETFEKKKYTFFELQPVNSTIGKSANLKSSGNQNNQHIVGKGTQNSSKGSNTYPNNLEEIEFDVPVRKKTQPVEIKDRSDTNSKISLKIDIVNEPEKDESGVEFRSKFTGSEIIIYSKHRSFKNRLEKVNVQPTINARLISYISAEVVLHHKSMLSDNNFNNELSQGKVLSEYITSVYEFEKYLKSLEGENINVLQ
jgi:hypothetical protein